MELAKRIDRSEPTVGRYERGRFGRLGSADRRQLAERIQEATGAPPEWLGLATEPEDADSRFDRLEDAIRWMAEMALDQDEAVQFEQMLSNGRRSAKREPGGGS